MERVDILITLIGTSAMPNLQAIVNRIKTTSTVIMLHTKETEKICDNIKALLKQKSASKLQVKIVKLEQMHEPDSVYREMTNTFRTIKEGLNIENKNIELNYTGGTKILSGLAYISFKEVFADYNKLATIAYIDPEKNKIFVTSINNIENYSIEINKNLEIYPINIEDILKMHNDNNKKIESGSKICSSFSKDIMKYITSENISSTDKNKLIYELSDMKNHKDKKDYIQRITILLNNNKNIFKGHSNFLKLNRYICMTYNKTSQSDAIGKLTDLMNGIWFEEVCTDVMMQLQQDNIIDEFLVNVERKECETELEIDIVALKNQRMYFVSLTTSSRKEIVLLKLLEVKDRGSIMAGKESYCASLSFTDFVMDIKNSYSYIFENDNKALILGFSDLSLLKDKLCRWIGGEP